jgi:hypothetical protein
MNLDTQTMGRQFRATPRRGQRCLVNPKSAARLFAVFVLATLMMVGIPVLNANAQTTSTRGLDLIFNERGRVSMSSNALGTNSPEGQLRLVKPAGATVRRAVLMAVTTGSSFSPLLPSMPVLVDGTPVAMGHEIASNIYSYNYWTDVTDLVRSKVDGAATGEISFAIREPSQVGLDGTALVVIFDDPSVTETKSVAVLFGALKTTGDEFTIGLETAFTPQSELVMSLGISFGFQEDQLRQQYSTISVNNQLVTSAAGGSDDGDAANGSLITIGGVGDSISNPTDPTAPPTGSRSDDELYDLRPFVPVGATSLSVTTRNPSNDDNIFFASFVSNPPARSITVDNCENGSTGDPIVVPLPAQTLGEKLTTLSHPASLPVAVSVPAGVYSVAQGSFDDAHPLQEDQPNERWFAEFYDVNGTSIGTTATTPDLGLANAAERWSNGSVVLLANATSVVFRHAPGGDGPDSVYPNLLELTPGGQYPPKPPCPSPPTKSTITTLVPVKGPPLPNGATPVEATPVFGDGPAVGGGAGDRSTPVPVTPGTVRLSEPISPPVAVVPVTTAAGSYVASTTSSVPLVDSSVNTVQKVEVLGVEIENASPAVVLAAPTAQVAFTGAQSIAMVLASLAMIGAGAAALLVARKHRHA